MAQQIKVPASSSKAEQGQNHQSRVYSYAAIYNLHGLSTAEITETLTVLQVVGPIFKYTGPTTKHNIYTIL